MKDDRVLRFAVPETRRGDEGLIIPASGNMTDRSAAQEVYHPLSAFLGRRCALAGVTSRV